MIDKDDTASVCYLEYILPFPDCFISNTKVARIWHTTGTQLAHLTALATEAVSTGADARVGTHTN